MTRYRLIFLVLLCMLELPYSTQLQSSDLANLQVSENGRFLVRQDGSIFFPVTDTAWAIAWKLNRNQIETYLQHRRDQQFNMIALVAFPSYEDHIVVANSNGDHAFAIRNGKYDPLRPTTTTGHRPADANEYDYWDHLEYIIDSAAAKGMYVILLPAWGGHVAGGYGNGKDTSGIILRLPESYLYGQWIGRRFNNKKNVIWMLGGDRSAVYGDKDYRNVFASLAKGIADGVNGVNQPDAEADYSTTLISYHPQKWAPNSSHWFHNSAWLDFNSIQDQPRDQIAATELDYELTPAKPTWLFEGGYEHRRNVYNDWQIRFQSYQTVFAGGFGITYGNMKVFDFGGEWEKHLEDRGSQQMQHLMTLMTSLSKDQFLDRIPDQGLIEGDQGRMDGAEGDRSSRLQATRGTRGDYAMVYGANGRNIALRMNRLSAPGKNAFWFNPRNGRWRIQGGDRTDRKPFMKDIPSGPTAPVQEFDPPGTAGEGNDWVLVLN